MNGHLLDLLDECDDYILMFSKRYVAERDAPGFVSALKASGRDRLFVSNSTKYIKTACVLLLLVLMVALCWVVMTWVGGSRAAVELGDKVLDGLMEMFPGEQRSSLYFKG